MTETSETTSQADQIETKAPSKRSSRKLMATAVAALVINGAAAIYTMPSFDIAMPDFSKVAELLPHEKASVPTPDPVVAALKDVQSAQEQHTASLQETNSSLQQNTALLQQSSSTLVGLRQSVTDERGDLKNISSQLSTLMAKVDTLQNAIAPEFTSSISKGHAHNRLSVATHKKWAHPSKSAGPISVGGAPLTMAPAPATVQSPEG